MYVVSLAEICERFCKSSFSSTPVDKKICHFEWDNTCHDSFAILKSHLCSAPILSYPHFNQPFHLYTDASQTALGYILGQIIYRKEHVVPCGGRELNTAEKKVQYY